MGLLSLFQLNLRRALVVKPEHAFIAPARTTAFAITATRTRNFTAPARVRDFIAGA